MLQHLQISDSAKSVCHPRRLSSIADLPAKLYHRWDRALLLTSSRTFLFCSAGLSLAQTTVRTTPCSSTPSVMTATSRKSVHRWSSQPHFLAVVLIFLFVNTACRTCCHNAPTSRYLHLNSLGSSRCVKKHPPKISPPSVDRRYSYVNRYMK